MSAQRRAAALFDGRHDLELAQAQVPALLWRQAGPWMRKMSATSRAERATAATYAGGRRLQRADHLAQELGGHVGIERCGLELLVPEQHLDHADVDLLLQQVGGEAVAQRVHRHALVDLRRRRRRHGWRG